MKTFAYRGKENYFAIKTGFLVAKQIEIEVLKVLIPDGMSEAVPMDST